MTLDGTSLVTRLLVAVLLYFLFNVVIDTTIKDAQANQLFKVILLIICLALVFVGGFFIRF